MNKERTETTLLLLCSVDGKITTGDNDSLDSDRDWRQIRGVKEGLQQYYEVEYSMAINSLNSGRVMEKIGINERTNTPEKDGRLTFFIIDRKPHLTVNGISYLANWVGKLVIVTNNLYHPAFKLLTNHNNLKVIYYENNIDLLDLLIKVKHDYGINHLILEPGGTLASAFLRAGLIDHISLIIAPLLVGGKNTPSIIDGDSIHSVDELYKLRALKLKRCDILEHSYLHLEYDVINNTVID